MAVLVNTVILKLFEVLEISSLTEQLLTSQGGLCFMEWLNSLYSTDEAQACSDILGDLSLCVLSVYTEVQILGFIFGSVKAR
jgi:hypothetical protein